MSLKEEAQQDTTSDLGDFVIVLLAGTLAELRDRLWDDGFHAAADVVSDLTCRCERYIEDRV